jgi:hypothetical protein
VKEVPVCFALALITSVAMAEGIPVYGLGTSPCSQYSADVRLRGDIMRLAYFSWAQGFISASNALLSQNEGLVGNLRSTDPSDQSLWIEKYCNGHPQEEFSRAAMKLLDYLRQKEGLKPLLN